MWDHHDRHREAGAQNHVLASDTCLNHCSRFQRAPLTCGACAKNIISGESITADIEKLAELKPDELLYWSHDNRAMSHLPYMIILDRYAALGPFMLLRQIMCSVQETHLVQTFQVDPHMLHVMCCAVLES